MTAAPVPGSTAGGGDAATVIPRQAWVMLVVATLGFAVNFWAWALVSPLGAFFICISSKGTGKGMETR